MISVAVKRIMSRLLRGRVANLIYNKITLFSNQRHLKHALSEKGGKKKLRCVFFALFEDIWKYDGVYRIMEESDRFEPIILVCPIVNYGKENMLERMKKCYSYFLNKGYNVILSYYEQTDRYIDVNKDLSPDVILYTNPYKGLIDDRYYISNFKDVLTVYVPYVFSCVSGYDWTYNEPLHNWVWRHYLGTNLHKQLGCKYSQCKGRNIVVTGYPGIEEFLSQQLANEERVQNKKKTIIWAPHHTISKTLTIEMSCFDRYCDFMVDLARRYSDKVEFVFKPHPLLKNKLYKEGWGKQRTDEYYHLWEKMENTSINEGDYVELFKNSDALIHDCVSFTVEYLYENKPVLRTLNGVSLDSMFDEFGMSCISNHYLANNEQEIEKFVQNVINGIDPLKEKRSKFINDVLIPKGSPSQNIVDDILDSIDNQILYRN